MITLTLEGAYEKHSDYPMQSLFPRLFAESFKFLGDSFDVHSHYAAVPFTDHLLALSNCRFQIHDGDMAVRIVRGSILLAYTGMGKSPLLKFAFDAATATAWLRN